MQRKYAFTLVLSLFFASIIVLGPGVPGYCQTDEVATRGLARTYAKGTEKLVRKLESQLDKSARYTVTIAGFHPSSGPNLNFSSIIEAELAKEFSSRPMFTVTFYKDNEEALKIIRLSQTAYFDRAIELGKFVSADYLITGEYSDTGRVVRLLVTIQDLKKNVKIAGDDIEIRKSSLPKNAFEPVPVDPKPIDESLNELVEAINYPGVARPRVLVGNFTYADTPVPSTFGLYLKDRIQAMMVQSQKYSVLSGNEAHTLNATGKYDAKQTMRGLDNTVNLLVTGRYWDMGNRIGIGLILKDDQDVVLHSGEVEVDKTSVPSTLAIKPDSLDLIRDRIKTFDAFDPPAKPEDEPSRDDLLIKVWPSKGNGAVYKTGEKVFFHFKANRDCYLILVHTNTNGDVQYLFPNSHARDNFIKANTLYTIPEGWDIDVTEPYGFEMIKAMASTRQFDEIKKINWDKIDGVIAPGSIRGLMVNAKAAIQATDECTLMTAAK